jgi:citrate lyase subunit beta / citryl-CoA lyase
MLAKAAGLDADEVVVDLEDGVAVAEKETARMNLASASARGTLAVRINGVRTPWWRDDLAAAAQVDVIVVPKVE